MRQLRFLCFLFLLLAHSLISGVASQEASSGHKEHIVSAGQTLYGISKIYKVRLDELYKLNPDCVNGLKSGDKILIPNAQDLSSAVGTQQRSADTTPHQTLAAHTIEPKETLYSVSKLYGLTVQELLDLNPGLSIESFQIGRVVQVASSNVKVKSAERADNTTPVEMMNSGIARKLVLPKSRGRIQVALLLPFLIGESPTPQDLPKARFVEFYEGVLMALDSLKSLGADIELHVFDEGSVANNAKIQTLINNSSLSDKDLVIGPVHKEKVSLLSDYIESHKIPLVIPFTSKCSEVATNPYLIEINSLTPHRVDRINKEILSLSSGKNIILIGADADKQDRDNEPNFTRDLLVRLKAKRVSYQQISQDAIQAGVLKSLLKKDRENIIIPLSPTESFYQYIEPALIAHYMDYKIRLIGHPSYQSFKPEVESNFHLFNTTIYSRFSDDSLREDYQRLQLRYHYLYSKEMAPLYPRLGVFGYNMAMGFIKPMLSELSLNPPIEPLESGFLMIQRKADGGYQNENLFKIQYQSDGTISRTIID